MLTLFDIWIFYFYFGDILYEQTQIQGRASFSDIILSLKYRREDWSSWRVPTLWMALIFFFFFFRWLECVQHDACEIWILLIILLISIINSYDFFFEKKNLISIPIIFGYFGALKYDTLTVIQLSIKDDRNRGKSFSVQTV